MSHRSSAARSQSFMDFSETELNKLQRQYLRAEAANRAYMKKTKVILNRDQREIQRLQDEHEELTRSLRGSHGCSTHQADAQNALLASGDRLDVELEAEKAKVVSLKSQILEWEKKLAGLRGDRSSTSGSCKPDDRRLLKPTRLIENKLHRGRKNLSKLMTRNGELREELKTLQVEKKHFLRVKSLLEKELHAIHKDVCNLMTKYNEAFNVSGKNKEKLKIMKEQNDKDVTQFIRQRISLEREISHYCNFERFMHMKVSANINQDIDHREAEKLKLLESKAWGVGDFQRAITEMLKETEENDLDKLVQDFIQTEKQNYTLLNFINRQCSEAEAIRSQISQLGSRREVCEVEERRRQEQHRAFLRTVSTEQKAVEQQLAAHQQHTERLEKLLDQVKEAVSTMLQLSFDSSVICDELGSADGVLDDNIAQCLRMLEDKLIELFTLQSYLHFQQKLSQWDTDSLCTIAAQLLGITSQGVKVTTAAAPCLDSDSTESVLLEAKSPMSREELLTLIDKRIQSRKTTN
ncbi:outer dynein arm-docking complex subunit 1-like isoform X2 [Mugil cephalus]|uniref:outer dynein arm-docking complex subunit 1-like isoform X2 n=1 Tax=Mugil cephalus TaxID=48193 RepID=UPI001FB679D0|nr:outer dynein arm-docking complex subunit 1-like isoform X2 [Mugil cephalus]